MPHVHDPAAPKAPLLVPRPRPGVVNTAAIFMFTGAAAGVANAFVAIATSTSLAREFRNRAAQTRATPAQVEEIASGLHSWSLGAGVVGLALAVVIGALALGVLRGSQACRTTAIVLAGASVCGGLAWSAFTVRGSTNLEPEGMDPQTSRLVSEAMGTSMSGAPTYIGGGLTCLQVLGYIAVVALLAWPTANTYFRRRPPAPSPETTTP
jgi:hypothetical protein